MIGLKRGTVKLVEHDPSWKVVYVEERERVKNILGGLIGTYEHIGSTAIPNIKAKPIIDFMAGVSSLIEARQLIPLLESQGYEYRENGDTADRILLVLGKPECRTHHFSLVVRHSKQWRDAIGFRDYLLTHPETAVRYAELKNNLANQYHADRAAYTAGKEEFIYSIIALANKKVSM